MYESVHKSSDSLFQFLKGLFLQIMESNVLMKAVYIKITWANNNYLAQRYVCHKTKTISLENLH